MCRIISANRNFFLLLVLFIITSVLSSCGDESEEKSNYDVVFAQDVVKRLDITIEPEDWHTMWEDMTSMLGEFGENTSTPIPPEWFEVCEGKQIRDVCKFSVGPVNLDGICVRLDFEEDRLGCLPLYALKGSNSNLVPRKPVYRPCTLVFEGKPWQHVGIRFKGNSSLATPWKVGVGKLPFRLDFDEFEDEHPEIRNQRFFGFKRLTLSNNFGDNALLREKVVADIFRRAGVPTPWSAFYRLFVDFGEGPTYFGLYTMVEVPEKPMFETQFGADGGNLYKPEGKGACWGTFDEESFIKKTNEEERDWSDIKAAFTALHASREGPESWRTGLEEMFDVHGFLRWLAVNTVIKNWDTYGNLAQNYYLYSDPADSRLHWIPWDNNSSFRSRGLLDPLSLKLSEVEESWPLIRYLIDDPVYRTTYISFANETIEGIFDAEMVQTRFKTEHNLIAPYVVGPEGEQGGYTFLFDPQDFYLELDILCNYVVQRHQEVLQFLEDENFEPPRILINEIHYNPSPAQGSDDDYEFIELYHAGASTIDLSGYSFSDGIEFTFPQDTTISAREYILVAKNGTTYGGQGYQVFQWTRGNLSNGGEILQLEDASGIVIDYLKYDDKAPWPLEPDADGPSLELINASWVNYLPENWRASDLVGGTPGLPNSD